MRIMPSTRSTLLTLVGAINRECDHPRHDLFTLFTYYENYGETAPTQNEIKDATGISLRNIKAGTDGLIAVGFLKLDILPSNKRRITPLNISSLDVDASVYLILDTYSNRYKSKKEEIEDVYVQTGKTAKSNRTSMSDLKSQKGQWKLDDIKDDPDWKRAETILLKYFKPRQISPILLTKHNYFAKLIELLDQVDFEAYCKWYRIEKYPIKKFHFGLFLYPSMITEFEDAIEEDDTYLNVSSNMENSEAYQKLLEEQEKTLITEFGRGKDAK